MIFPSHLFIKFSYSQLSEIVKTHSAMENAETEYELADSFSKFHEAVEKLNAMIKEERDKK